jgi:hypothetical protein
MQNDNAKSLQKSARAGALALLEPTFGNFWAFLEKVFLYLISK